MSEKYFYLKFLYGFVKTVPGEELPERWISEQHKRLLYHQHLFYL